MEGDDWEECRNLFKFEKEKVGDIAEMTVCESMQQKVDIGVASTTARWYLDRKAYGQGLWKEGAAHFGRRLQPYTDAAHFGSGGRIELIAPMQEGDFKSDGNLGAKQNKG